MNKKMYREGTTLNEIVSDGWSRGFEPDQTLREAAAMGHNITMEDLLREWKKMDDEMDGYFKAHPGEGEDL